MLSLIKQQLTANAGLEKETLHKAPGAESQRDERERERWNPLVTHVPIPSSLRGGGNAQVLAAESFCLAPMGDGWRRAER